MQRKEWKLYLNSQKTQRFDPNLKNQIHMCDTKQWHSGISTHQYGSAKSYTKHSLPFFCRSAQVSKIIGDKGCYSANARWKWYRMPNLKSIKITSRDSVNWYPQNQLWPDRDRDSTIQLNLALWYHFRPNDVFLSIFIQHDETFAMPCPATTRCYSNTMDWTLVDPEYTQISVCESRHAYRTHETACTDIAAVMTNTAPDSNTNQRISAMS